MNSKKFIVTGKFQDKNQPALIYHEKTLFMAHSSVISCSHFAGLKCIFIDTPENVRHVYNPLGKYLFTVKMC